MRRLCMRSCSPSLNIVEGFVAIGRLHFAVVNETLWCRNSHNPAQLARRSDKGDPPQLAPRQWANPSTAEWGI